jgi:hypothetical protein
MSFACHQIDGVIANQNQADKLLLLAESTWYLLCHDEPGDDQH